MKIYTTAFLFIVLNVFIHLSANAQVRIKFRGLVLDTTNVGIPGTNVRLISGKDTLFSNTDNSGAFSFSNLKNGTATLLIRGIGYKPYSTAFTLKEGVTEQILPTVFLKSAALQLNEVIIKGNVVPMRVMKDTVEFNADAYAVHENDIKLMIY
ncbi:carboxypeptidase regulatory-like domain-containing protein [Pedobacter sp. NJ-S-72]